MTEERTDRQFIHNESIDTLRKLRKNNNKKDPPSTSLNGCLGNSHDYSEEKMKHFDIEYNPKIKVDHHQDDVEADASFRRELNNER